MCHVYTSKFRAGERLVFHSPVTWWLPELLTMTIQYGKLKLSLNFGNRFRYRPENDIKTYWARLVPPTLHTTASLGYHSQVRLMFYVRVESFNFLRDE